MFMLEKLGKCEICGMDVWETPGEYQHYKRTPEGIVHLDCYFRESEQEKINHKLTLEL